MKNCPFCGSRSIVVKGNESNEAAWVLCCVCGAEGPLKQTEEKAISAWDEAIRHEPKEKEDEGYPQAAEPNEYRYIQPAWLDAIARGLTEGAKHYPGETWRNIPAREHAWRAVRHLIMYQMGNRSESHLVNASMRCMMSFEQDKNGLVTDIDVGREKEGD